MDAAISPGSSVRRMLRIFEKKRASEITYVCYKGPVKFSGEVPVESL